MQKILLALTVVGAFTFASCRKANIDAGASTTENRTVGTFDELVVDGSMDVYITQDSSYEVRVEAGERLIQYIETEVEGDRLRVFERKNRVIRDRKVRVYVSAAVLNHIELDGSGDISGDNLTANAMEVSLDGSGDIDLGALAVTSLQVRIKGSGDIKVEGDATSLDYEVNGSGDLNGRFMEAQDADVFLDGSGDIKVYCANSLDATLFGSGDIEYWGNPTTVNTTVDGSGDITGM